MLLGYLHFLGLVNHDSTYLNPKCLTSSRCSLALATAHITFFGTHPTFTQVPVQQRGNKRNGNGRNNASTQVPRRK